MKHPLPAIFRTEAALATLTGCLGLLTLIKRDWIESVFGIDPDHGGGSLEWLIIAALLIVTVSLAARARRHWQQHRDRALAHPDSDELVTPPVPRCSSSASTRSALRS
jgi:hypothetical protein